MENEVKNNDKKLKWLIGMLAVLLVVLTVFTVNMYSDFQKDTAHLEIEKQAIEQELETLLTNYDMAIEESEFKDNELITARERIERLLDSVKDMEANTQLISRYRTEIGKLKSERDFLFKKADSLQMIASNLQIERDSTFLMLDQSTRYADSITLQNEALAKVIVKGAALKVSGLNAEGVFQRRSGKVIETDKSRRADQIRTCFSLNENEIAEAGNKLLYVQVINPKNNVIGEKATVNFEENILTYSAATAVYYENDTIDVCLMIDGKEEELVAGNYVVNVFEGPRLLSTTRLKLD
ncbi:MAG TPA: hypothetical protein VFD80_08170 [Flavobacteriaceae bacterium]|nr:hypothetical protein [Flavobacteriaceae bacterium]